MLAKKGIGIAPILPKSIPDEARYRISGAWIGAVLKGGIYSFTVYLRHSEGLSPENMVLLDYTAAALGALKGPWVIGGDWNLSPQVLADSKWLQIVDGVVFATQLDTCNDNVYDFFVVHRSIAQAVVGVQRLQDGNLNPHWVTRLLIRGDARRLPVRKLVKAPMVPGFLPKGPPLCGSD